MLRDLEIDIAIELSGHTEHSRFGMLALRAGSRPGQLPRLSRPRSARAHVDYILADQIVLPPDQTGFYVEKVAWLPDAYMVNDNSRPIAERTPTRGECGLPDDGFVFCCFNNLLKLNPASFEVWMRLLGRVPAACCG